MTDQQSKQFEFIKAYKHYPRYREAYNEWSDASYEANRLDHLDDHIIGTQENLERNLKELQEAAKKLTKPLDEYARHYRGFNRDDPYEYKNPRAEKVRLLTNIVTGYEEQLARAEQDFENLSELTAENDRRLHNAALQLELEEQATQKKIEAKQAQQERKEQRQAELNNSIAQLNTNPIQLPDQTEAGVLKELLQITKPHPLATIHLNGNEVMVHLDVLRELLGLLPNHDQVHLSFEQDADQTVYTYGGHKVEHLPVALVVDYEGGKARFVPVRNTNGAEGSVALVIRPTQELLAEQVGQQ